MFLALATNALDPSVFGLNWLYEFSNDLTDLTTQNADALTQLGTTFLSFIAIVKLVTMVINIQMQGMTLSFSTRPMNVGDFMEFLITFVICLLLENYWVNPIPGSGLSLNHFFSYIAQLIVSAIDKKSIDVLLNLLSGAILHTPRPPAFAVIEIITYVLIVGLMSFATAILFYINCSSFIFYAVSALFAPLFIPTLMSNRLKPKFYSFVDVLIGFAMIRAVASAFIFVWATFLTTFVQRTFNGDYSIGMWETHLEAVLAVFGAFILNLTQVPRITQIIFGGSAGTAGRIGDIVESAIIRKAVR